MKRRFLSTAVSFLMIGLALAGTLISCDGTNAIAAANMDEVEVKALVVDETKSLDATFGATVANDVTHYRWVMTHKNPTRVYDTGYVPRATAEANQLYANMNGSHKILTGAYDWTFSGYVCDGAGTADANYHLVAQVSKSDEIINAKTPSVAVVLDTLTGQNQGAEITAIVPVDFYSAYQSGPARVRATISAVNAVTGEPAVFSGDQGTISDTGTANRLRITLGSIPTGSYRLTVRLDLRNEALEAESVDSKTAVTVLRSIPGSTARGEMNFASSSLTINALNVSLTDNTGDIIIPSDISDFEMEGLDVNTYTNSGTAEISLEYPHTANTTVEWHIDGRTAEASKISEGATAGDVTTYTVLAGALEEGDHILTALLIDTDRNMAAGSVEFRVTVKEASVLSGEQPVEESDVKGGFFKGTTEAYSYFVVFGEDGRSAQAMDTDPGKKGSSVTANLNGYMPYSVSPGSLTLGGQPSSATYDPSTGILNVPAMGTPLTKTDISAVSDSVLAVTAASGVDYDGVPSITSAQMKGYWEQCDSTGNSIGDGKKWIWLGGEASDTFMEQTRNAAIGTLSGGAAQDTRIASRWNIHGTANLLSVITADMTESEHRMADTLSYTFEADHSGDVYSLKVIYSSSYDDYQDTGAFLKIGETYYFRQTAMDPAVQTALTDAGATV